MSRRRAVVAPISRDAALQRELVLSEKKHFLPVVQPTQQKYERILQRWKEFYSWKGDDPDDCLQVRESRPSAGKLKMFMEYLFDTSVGILAEKVTLKTLRNSWYSFRSAYERTTYTAITNETGLDVLAYIKSDLRDKGLVRRERAKHLADQLDISWILEYLWCYDKYYFQHPRERLQLSFILILMIYTGVRAGTIVESSAYRGSNQALCYKDFQLIGLRTRDRGMELVLKVRFRLEKRKRQQKGDTDDNPQFKWVTFHTDRSCAGRCPIRHFLALAFGDDVFEGLQDPSNLQYLHVPTNAQSLHFEIKESQKDLLIFRRCDRDGSMSKTRATPYNWLSTQLPLLGERAGFRDPLSTYAVRRGNVNSITGDVTISSGQYEHLLGHSLKVRDEHYISNISAVDTQGIINGEGQRRDHIKQLQGMTLNFNLDAPIDLPFSKNQELLNDKEFVQLQAKELSLWNARDTNLGAHNEYRKASASRRAWYLNHQTHALKEYRQQFFLQASTDEMRKQIEDGKLLAITGLLCQQDKKPHLNDRLEFVSKDLFCDQATIAHSWWVAPAGDILQDTLVLAHMKRLCDPAAFVLYYPGQSPLHGRCPVCEIEMCNIGRLDRPWHIHACLKGQRFQISRTTFKSNFPKICRWEGCKNTQLQKKVLYLREDFGDSIIGPHARVQARQKEAKRLYEERRRPGKKTVGSAQITSDKVLCMHFMRHINKSTLLRCKWDGCALLCNSKLDLRKHFFNIHGVCIRQAVFTPQFCFDHPSCGFFTDEFEWESHCELHLNSNSCSGGLRRAYGAVVSCLVCPFCLGAEGLAASERYRQWCTIEGFNRHMQEHWRRVIVDVLPCPVPGCATNLMDRQELQVHFADAHQILPHYYAKTRGIINYKKEDSPLSAFRNEDDDWEDTNSEMDMQSEAESDWEDDDTNDVVSSNIVFPLDRLFNDYSHDLENRQVSSSVLSTQVEAETPSVQSKSYDDTFGFYNNTAQSQSVTADGTLDPSLMVQSSK